MATDPGLENRTEIDGTNLELRKADVSRQSVEIESPAVDVYPSEGTRKSITGIVVGSEVVKDQWDRQTIILAVVAGNESYLCKFPHEEAKRLFGQIAALITQGNAKGFLITLSGLPKGYESYKEGEINLLVNCRFTHWQIM